MKTPSNVTPVEHVCSTCSRSFARVGHLNRHMRTHTGERPHRCQFPSCGKTFLRKDHLTRHQYSHKQERPFPCPFPSCDKSFATAQRLTRHKMLHNKPRPFKCDKCDRTFLKRQLLIAHRSAHGEDETAPYVCDVPNCQSPPPPNPRLQWAKSKPSTSRTFTCPAQGCSSLSFQSLSELNKHVQSTHPSQKQFECTRCARRVRSAPALARHIAACEAGSFSRQHRCSYPGCSAVYTSSGNLGTHVRSKHVNPDGFLCEQCRRRFSLKSSLERHKRTVHPEQNSVCVVCNIELPNADALRKHLYEQHNLHDTSAGLPSMLNKRTMDLNESLESQQNQHTYETDRSAILAPGTGDCQPHEPYAQREHLPPNPASMGVPTHSHPFALVQSSKAELVGEQQSSSQAMRIPGLRPNLDVDSRVFDERLNAQPERNVQQQHPNPLPPSATFQTHMSPVAKRRCLSPPLPVPATSLRGKAPADILQISTTQLQGFAHDNTSFRAWETTGQPCLRISSPPDKYGSKPDVSPSAISTLFTTDEVNRDSSFRQNAIQPHLMKFGRVEGMPNGTLARNTLMRQQTKFGDLQRRMEGEQSDVNELMYRVQATPTFGNQSKMPAVPLETSTAGLPDLFVGANGQVDAYYGGETRQFLPQDPGAVTNGTLAEQALAPRNISQPDAKASATSQLVKTSENRNVDRLGIRMMTARA